MRIVDVERDHRRGYGRVHALHGDRHAVQPVAGQRLDEETKSISPDRVSMLMIGFLALGRCPASGPVIGIAVRARSGARPAGGGTARRLR